MNEYEYKTVVDGFVDVHYQTIWLNDWNKDRWEFVQFIPIEEIKLNELADYPVYGIYIFKRKINK